MLATSIICMLPEQHPPKQFLSMFQGSWSFAQSVPRQLVRMSLGICSECPKAVGQVV